MVVLTGWHERLHQLLIHNTLETDMWKLAIGFVVFAAVALFVIMKAGDKVDMSGEKHGADAIHAPAESK